MLIVVDDYSRKTLVFVLKHKFDTIVRIRQLRVLIEKKIGTCVD